MNASHSNQVDTTLWQVPKFRLTELSEKKTDYCIAIPVINEGDRIIGQLAEMQRLGLDQQADILILDGGSTDGSMDEGRLKSLGVRTLLVKVGQGKQGAQMRIGYSYAMHQGYGGIVAIDGNNKDGVEGIPQMLRSLDEGWDLVQGSRYIPGGRAVRTPWIRELAIKLIHVPFMRLASGFPYTDTTNAFRAYSRRFLLDPKVQPFRDVFQTYELLAYLSVRAPQLKYRVKEVPVRREYPAAGKTPTKISHFRGNLLLLRILGQVLTGGFNPGRTRLLNSNQR